MLEDPLLDVLLAAVAVTMLILALEVHSLKQFRSPGQALASEAPKKEELSPTERERARYLKQFEPKESAVKLEEKPPLPEETNTTTLAVEAPGLPRGKSSEPFRPEALAGEE